ncbi:MAG: AcrB/AcrD/AcrF family protein [Gammaproteobacteria bacterium]|nr:MAG: AcrB/AcrD/AcrF family protein [Gammaproteobacteria bacterium]
MNLAKAALEYKAVSYFVTFLLLVVGIFAYFNLGQLEDPEFSVKTAAITVNYPGASAEQVELEVIDLIETQIQEMIELKHIYSMARPGQAIIKVDLKNHYWSNDLPQIWDTLRKKITDIEHLLPPGASKPVVGDDFGFVFGFLLGVTADGYSYARLNEHVKALRKELKVIPNVARVDTWGVQKRQIYIDVSQSQLSQIGLTKEDVAATLQKQNMVVDAGSVDYQGQRFRVAPTGEFVSSSQIGDLAISGVTGQERVKGGHGDELIRVRDIGTVREGYIEPPLQMMRINGLPAIGLPIAPAAGANVVKVGLDIDKRIAELQSALPVGIELHRISWQSDLVDESISAFMVSLMQAIAIVLVILAVSMGLRVGIIIGLTGLVFAILGSFIIMSIWGIDLQRVSLGALIIAMGMMVDNAIVVVDGFVVRLKKGMDRKAAAIEAAAQPSIPLLGATIVACMAFYPIFSSTYDTGEYASSLFQVVAIALIVSWLLSQTITPLVCVDFLPDPKGDGGDPYNTRFYQLFRRLLGSFIRYRAIFLTMMIIALGASIYGFKDVKQLFFPDSSRTQFMIDYWATEGTRIQQTSSSLELIEKELGSYDEVTTVSSFIGSGPPRFYLPVNPESAYSSYAQIIINIDTLANVEVAINKIENWLEQNNPGHIARVRKYAVGAWDDWKFEARFSGPANADPEVLRELAKQGMAILQASPYSKEVRTNWRQRSREMVVEYNQERARWAGISRENIAQATKRTFDGNVMGLYREKDELIPIVIRSVEDERQRAATDLAVVQVNPDRSTESLPLSQVIDDTYLKWNDNIIWRWDRRRAISVQASPHNVTAPVLMADVKEKFEAVPLPPGYTLEWDGEYDSAKQSSDALLPGLGPAIAIMLLIIVALSNAYRPPLIMILVIPFVMIGITPGLLMMDAAFGFIALLGIMSLAGMMIKNSVVLLDQINLNIAAGLSPYKATIEAAVERLNPVVNAAATTVFGMIPLLGDVFWFALAVTIMFGLAFGTLLTMLLVPVLYATFYRLHAPKEN